MAFSLVPAKEEHTVVLLLAWQACSITLITLWSS